MSAEIRVGVLGKRSATEVIFQNQPFSKLPCRTASRFFERPVQGELIFCQRDRELREEHQRLMERHRRLQKLLTRERFHRQCLVFRKPVPEPNRTQKKTSPASGTRASHTCKSMSSPLIQFALFVLDQFPEELTEKVCKFGDLKDKNAVRVESKRRGISINMVVISLNLLLRFFEGDSTQTRQFLEDLEFSFFLPDNRYCWRRVFSSLLGRWKSVLEWMFQFLDGEEFFLNLCLLTKRPPSRGDPPHLSGQKELPCPRHSHSNVSRQVCFFFFASCSETCPEENLWS